MSRKAINIVTPTQASATIISTVTRVTLGFFIGAATLARPGGPAHCPGGQPIIGPLQSLGHWWQSMQITSASYVVCPIGCAK